MVKRDQWTDNPDGSVSQDLEFDELLDVSPVTYSAYPATNAQASSLPASTPAAIRAKLEKRSATQTTAIVHVPIARRTIAVAAATQFVTA